MSAWGRRGIVGASVRKRRAIGAITAIVAVALTIVAVSVGGTVDSVTLQSPKSNSAGIVSDGVAPGALIEANVTITLANNETLDRLLVSHDGSSQCLDVGNATGDSNGETVSRTVTFTARGVPGATDVTVRPYNSSDCNSNPVGSAKATAFTVLAPAANVDFAGSCTSLNIVLVLDESGSITDNATYVANVKSAATSFVTALNGTGANLKIVEFDEFATTPVDYTAVTAGNLATFTNYITNQYGSNSFHSTGAWTNWEDALEEANAGTKPDIVVFVTDGNPTAKDGETNFNDGDAEVLDLAFGRANELKLAAGDGKASHIYALGVGNALTQANAVTRLKGVSGNTSGSNIATDDYSIVADFSNLQQALRDLADQLCSREIRIVKQVDENADGTFSEDPNVDFRFDVQVTTSAGDVKWLVPGPTTEASPSTKTVTINGSGESTLRFTGATPGATVSAIVTEQTPLPTGYEQVGSNCTFSTGQLAAGARVTCTIQNRRKVGKLVVKKVVINNNGGLKGAADFAFDVSGPTASSDVPFEADGQNDLTVNAGTYNVVENADPGYTTTYSADCSNAVIATGGSKTCTITNDDKPAGLVVKKVVINNNGGLKGAADFAFDVSGPTASSDVPFEADGQNDLTVNAGTYNVVENADPGYTTTYSADCSNAVIATGGSKTCTITNDDKPAGLVVKKVVINNNGGLKGAADFAFDVSGPTASSDVPFEADGQNDLTVNAGTYNVVENADPGYTTTYSADCSNAVIATGGSKTCTITNDDKPAGLVVKKVVINNNGGLKGAADFAFDVSGPTASSDVPFEADGQNDLTVNAGTYNVVENADPGYTTTYSADCSNAVIATGGSKTCTITNDDKPAGLVVKKVVINNNGGLKGAADFAFDVSGPTASSDVPFEADGQNDLTVNAGTYNVVENADPGYTTTYSADCSNAVIATGGSKTCTITNDDKPAGLVVKKVVINNNGGLKGAADFAFDVSGPTASSDVPFEADGQNDLTVNAGTYNVVENADPGYTTTYSADCSNAVIATGGSKTCTITNDDKPAGLVVKKVVINNNGGLKGAADFAFDVSGPTASSDVPFEADGQNDLTVNAGTYNVVENADPGYTTTYSADCSNAVIATGGSKTCTITNDDKPGTIIVKKVVVNDEGGTKTAGAFGFKVGDADAVPFVEDGQEPLKGEKSVSVPAGTYTVTESAVDGYVASYENCERIVVGNGETKTCTITNDDQAGTIIVKKIVINDNGGAKKAADFSFQVNGGAATAFVKDADDLHGTNTVTIDAGKFTVVEADLPIAGYTTSYDGCSDVVANGETKTCTITNNDKPGAIIVKKIVINDEGGTKTAGDFTFKIGDADPVAFVEDVEKPLEGEKSVSVSAGTYTVTEPAVDGYVASYENCAGIVVGNGETKTCTITNDDSLPPTVDVQKTVRVAGTEDAFVETASAPESSGTFEYRVVVWNKSAEAVSLTALTDTIGAVVTNLDGKGSCSVPQQLAASDGSSGGADTYVCTFELTLAGNAGASQTDTVKATVTDDENDTATDEDSASASLTDLKSSIKVTKTADPTTIEESVNGSDVTYTVVVKNTSAVDKVSLDTSSFVDRVKANGDPATGAITAITNLDCDLEDNESDGLPASLDPGASITCAFTMQVEGKAGDEVNDLITVTGRDDDGKSVSDSDDATVTITDVPSTITVTKTANPTVIQDSGPVTFTVVVRNDSAVDTVYITSLTDSIYGNLNPRGSCTLEDGIDEGPAGSRRILPSESYTCSFTETVSKTETDVVTASGVDDDEQSVSDSDDATVTVNRTPPPTYVPSTDISVTKAATAQVRLPQGGGSAAITYNLVVVNNGPDTATNVKVADTAPASVTFASATTSAGTCATTAQALDCTIASLAPGASVAIAIKATVNSTGTKVNVVVVTTSTPETNSNNNKASAQTLVLAPLTPPRVPAKVEEICRTLAANPKMLKATGKAQKISIRVTQGLKGVSGVKVKLTGPGISKVVTSGRGGNVKVTIKPSQPGIVRLAIQGKKACNAQRVGVVGVYEPPVTG